MDHSLLTGVVFSVRMFVCRKKCEGISSSNPTEVVGKEMWQGVVAQPIGRNIS